MNQTKPIYFLNNRFHGFNKEWFEFDKSKEYKTTEKSNILINKSNLIEACSKVYIPFSMLASNVQEVKFLDNIDDLEPHFFRIKTDEKIKFEFGYIDNRKFINQKEFIEELLKYDLLAGFNCFDYDLMVLQKEYPELFLYNKIDNYTIPILSNRLVLDMKFIYQLFNPARRDFSSLSKMALDLNFPEDRIEEDSEEKVKQDMRIMKFAYEKIPVKEVWKLMSELLLNLDRYVMQVVYTDRLRRYIFFQSLLEKGFLPMKFPDTHRVKKVFKQFLLCKPGIYKSVKYFDVSSAYPVSATQKEFSIYLKGDFTDLIKKYLELLKKYPELKSTIKFLSNAQIGDMMDKNNFCRNETIRNNIVRIVARKLKSLVNDKIVFGNTDCVAGVNLEEPKLEGYEIKLKHDFKWVIFYNVNRWIGHDLISKTIEKRGFRREQKFSELYDYFDLLIEKELLKGNLNILKDPESLLKKIDFKKLDKKMFGFYVYKKNDVCTNPYFISVWHLLEQGFNLVFLGKGSLSLTKPHLPTYKHELKKYSKLYKIKEDWLNDQSKN